MEKKKERNILIVFWSSFIILNLIGYLINIDILKIFIIRENGRESQKGVDDLSNHVKLGFKVKMEKGELIGFNGCLGYDYDSTTKSFSVNEEEKRLFNTYMIDTFKGIGATQIAKN